MAKHLCPICKTNTFGNWFGIVAKDGMFCGKCFDKLYDIKGKDFDTCNYTLREIADIIGANRYDDSVKVRNNEVNTKSNLSFFEGLRESAIKTKEDLAIANAYKEEEEKRKSHVKKVKHERPLTAQEQQAIDLIELKRDEKIAEWAREGVGLVEATLTRALPYDNKIEEIRNRAIWYEEVIIPPEIDPSVPIIIDEEAIRSRIRKYK